MEPDARNAKAIKRLRATCFELGPVIRLADKTRSWPCSTRTRFDLVARAEAVRAASTAGGNRGQRGTKARADRTSADKD